MYKTIMVPVDLAHTERLGKALDVAADLATHYGAAACLVGVTAETPTEVAHNPEEYAEKLSAFAKEAGAARSVAFETRALASHDPTADLDGALREAVDITGADLAVMASHVPGFAEYIFASNAGYLASHAKISVLVVR